jgi:hypothetical protein
VLDVVPTVHLPNFMVRRQQLKAQAAASRADVRLLDLLGLPTQGPSDNPVSDQWLPPFVITDDAGTPVGTVEDGDAVILFNFRADRMVQISKAFEYPDFAIFDRERFPKVGYTSGLKAFAIYEREYHTMFVFLSGCCRRTWHQPLTSMR